MTSGFRIKCGMTILVFLFKIAHAEMSGQTVGKFIFIQAVIRHAGSSIADLSTKTFAVIYFLYYNTTYVRCKNLRQY